MTTTPQNISWITPVYRPQYTSVNLNRKRDPITPSGVNVNWANQPFEPLTCQDEADRDARDSAKHSAHCQLQPRLSDRKYRPWMWELPGARFWPWLTVERHIIEELKLRHDRKMPHRRPLWPEDDLVRARPTVFAIEPHSTRCQAPLRETCCTERPFVCDHTRPKTPKFINFVNWQWIQ